MSRVFRCFRAICIIAFLLAVHFQYKYNAIDYVLSQPFFFFSYPLEIDMPALVAKVMKNQPSGVEPIFRVDYPFILNNAKMCKTSKGADSDVYLLFVIKSAVNKTDSRNAIRRTWANGSNVPGVTVKHVFMLGVSQDNLTIQRIVLEEQEKHNDIVQGYFVDTYYNNTIKLMMAFRWVTTNCKGARHVAFVDDDYFVSPSNLVSFLQSEVNQVEWTIYGFVLTSALPVRYKNKWHISRQEYPYRFYPPFPTGGAIFLSQEIAQRAYIAMHYTKYIRFDDVFLGIIAWKLEIPIKHCDGVFYLPEYLDEIRQKYLDMVIAVHGFKVKLRIIFNTDVPMRQKLWEST